MPTHPLMDTHQIPREKWSETLERFSAQHRDWLVSVQEQHGESPPFVVLGEAPLEAISVDEGGPDAEAVRVVLQRGDGPEGTVHRIARPWSLLLEETADQEHVGLTVVSHDGVRTGLRLRTAALPATVDQVL